MASHEFVVLLGLLLIVAFGAELLFRSLRVPPVLVLMVCGLAIGPGLSLLPAEGFLAVAPHFGAIAFLLILFEGGLDLDLDRVLGGLRAALSLALIGFVASGLLVLALASALGWRWRDALVLAIVLAPVSGAILIPLLGRLAFPASLRSTLVLEAALADVLGVLALSLAAQVVDVAGLRTLVAVGTIFAALASVAAGVAAGWFWPRATELLGEHRYVDVLTFGVALTLWGGVSTIGASGALAVFVFAFTLANRNEIRRALRLDTAVSAASTEELEALHSFVAQLTFVVRAFFFVFIGVVVQVDRLDRAALLLGAGSTLLLLFARRVALGRAGLGGSAPGDGAPLPLLVTLQPRGLVSAVLAIEAAHLGLPRGDEILPIASVVILATNVILGVGLVVWGGAAIGGGRSPAPG